MIPPLGMRIAALTQPIRFLHLSSHLSRDPCRDSHYGNDRDLIELFRKDTHSKCVTLNVSEQMSNVAASGMHNGQVSGFCNPIGDKQKSPKA